MHFKSLYLLLLAGFLAACGGAPTFNEQNPDSHAASSAINIASSVPTGAETAISSSESSATSVLSSTSSESSSFSLSSADSESSSSSVSSASSESSSAASSTQGSASCLTPPGTSHRAGKNCLSCHKTGGPGAAYAVFTVAGTAYKSDGTVQNQAMIKLFAHNTNNLIACIKTNELGNFYTTQAIADLASPGLDVEAEGPTGGLKPMSSVLTSGACNACHGVTVSKIVSD